MFSAVPVLAATVISRIAQIGVGDAADRRRHRCREQRGLARLRRLLQDALDVVDKAHAQHLVGFVQHQRLQLGQVERPLVQVVDHAARGADHHVHAAAQRRQLRTVALAAVDRQHVEAGDVRRIGWNASATWIASSRVGASTSACGVVCLISMRDRMGSAKAAVLPVPVWAWPSTSRLSSSEGMVAAWIGDGDS
jgi:hypothetical protein